MRGCAPHFIWLYVGADLPTGEGGGGARAPLPWSCQCLEWPFLCQALQLLHLFYMMNPSLRFHRPNHGTKPHGRSRGILLGVNLDIFDIGSIADGGFFYKVSPA